MTVTGSVKCSFCAKPQTAVAKIIAGNGGISICNECVSLCVQIIGEPSSSDETPTRIDWSRAAELIDRAATALESLDPALSAELAELRSVRIPPDTRV